ncbi:MAG: hypothetical protein CL869_02795 [Cytophagia bacterium]|nr:hypothetical protein [Cytophagia bacterium]|tara:strand:- start:158 stop:658 length:501 start_codon:yes stop_codon:yes gene_type:complete
MWLVAKIKPNQIEIFKKSLSEKLNKKVKYYYPRIVIKNNYKNKKHEKFCNLLGSYIFCFSDEFKEKKTVYLKYLKGLDYFLSSGKSCQNNIVEFINFCKSHENKDGILNSSFFLNFRAKNFKFTNGPLNNLFFNILKVNKTKIIGELSNRTKVIIDKLNYYQFLTN